MLSLHATYKKMGLKELEKWAKLDQKIFNDMLVSGRINGYVILKTCNRVEIYFSTKLHSDIKNELVGIAVKMDSPNILFMEGIDSARHLMRVCSGLDSMVIGEQEIQRQVKEALTKAQNEKSSDKVLNYVFMKAINAGKEVREKTRISKGKVSVSQVALKLLEERGRSEDMNRICVVGTGNVGTTIVKYLKGSNKDITISGRSDARLRQFTKKFGINSVNISDLNAEMFDCVITATSSPDPVVKVNEGQKMPKLVIDLGNPRNVTAPRGKNYVDLDSLNSFVNKNIENRRMEMEKAEGIIEGKAAFLSKQYPFQN